MDEKFLDTEWYIEYEFLNIEISRIYYVVCVHLNLAHFKPRLVYGNIVGRRVVLSES